MSILYLIPVTLGESDRDAVIPAKHTEIIRSLSYFIVEDVRTARRFLKKTDKTIDLNELHFAVLNEHTTRDQLYELLRPAREGFSVGIMSEAGCPGVADPGAEVVRLAHEAGLRVVPLTGPSSILLAMMASGMNGQNFAFNGYLPIRKDEKIAALKKLEKRVYAENQSQVFIETPYRNQALFDDMLRHCLSGTRLCVACDLTLESEFIRTMTIGDWKKNRVDLQKRPAVFVLGR